MRRYYDYDYDNDDDLLNCLIVKLLRSGDEKMRR